MSKCRWVSPIPDGRVNSRTRESWWFENEDLAVEDAIREHTRKPAPKDKATRDWIWGQMKKQGWSITTRDRA